MLQPLTAQGFASWAFDGEDYRFSQVHPEVGLVAWEEGRWWIGGDFDGREAIVFQRLTGGTLASTRDGLVWFAAEAELKGIAVDFWKQTRDNEAAG